MLTFSKIDIYIYKKMSVFGTEVTVGSPVLLLLTKAGPSVLITCVIAKMCLVLARESAFTLCVMVYLRTRSPTGILWLCSMPCVLACDSVISVEIPINANARGLWRPGLFFRHFSTKPTHSSVARFWRLSSYVFSKESTSSR